MNNPIIPSDSNIPPTSKEVSAEQRAQLAARIDYAFRQVAGDAEMEKLRALLLEYFLGSSL